MIDLSQPAPCPAVAAGTLTIRRLAGRRGLLLDGEADLNSRGALRDALHALLCDDPGEIHLELAGLTFIDVSCTRELVTLTQFAHPARVILHNPPWSLQRITMLAWPHASIEVASASAEPPSPARLGEIGTTGAAFAIRAHKCDRGPQALRTAAVIRLLVHNALRVDEACGADVADLGTDTGHRVLRVTRKGARKARSR